MENEQDVLYYELDNLKVGWSMDIHNRYGQR